MFLLVIILGQAPDKGSVWLALVGVKMQPQQSRWVQGALLLLLLLLAGGITSAGEGCHRDTPAYENLCSEFLKADISQGMSSINFKKSLESTMKI